MLSDKNLVNNFIEELLFSREFRLFFLSNAGISFGMLAGTNKSKSDFGQFLFSLSTRCQPCGMRVAVYLLCEVLFMKLFSSGWVYDIKVDFCQMSVFAVLVSQITKGLDTRTSNVS